MYVVFVFATAFILGSAIGDGILFLLYVVPWIGVLSGSPKGSSEPSELWLIVGFLVPALIYSLIGGGILTLINYLRAKK